MLLPLAASQLQDFESLNAQLGVRLGLLCLVVLHLNLTEDLLLTVYGLGLVALPFWTNEPVFKMMTFIVYNLYYLMYALQKSDIRYA